MGYLQTQFNCISLNDQPIAQTGICKNRLLSGQFFELRCITEQGNFKNFHPVFQTSEMCCFRGGKKKGEQC